jgi:hypothetical protein
VARQFGHHTGRRTLLARLARLACLPAKVVVGRKHGKGGFQVLEVLAESQHQPVEPLHEQPLRAVNRSTCEVHIVLVSSSRMPNTPVHRVPTISLGV